MAAETTSTPAAPAAAAAPVPPPGPEYAVTDAVRALLDVGLPHCRAEPALSVCTDGVSCLCGPQEARADFPGAHHDLYGGRLVPSAPAFVISLTCARAQWLTRRQRRTSFGQKTPRMARRTPHTRRCVCRALRGRCLAFRLRSGTLLLAAVWLAGQHSHLPAHTPRTDVGSSVREAERVQPGARHAHKEAAEAA